MNKTELSDLVAAEAGVDKKTAAAAVDAVVDGVMDAVKVGQRVSLQGFGTFHPTSRAARTGRNPQTGAPVKIAASKSVRFAPGSAFKSLLNSKGGSAKKAAPAKKAASAKKAPAKKAAKSARKK